MLLRQESCDGVSVLRVSGEVDASGADALVTAVQRVLSKASAGMVLDLSAVTDLAEAARDLLTGLAPLSQQPRPRVVLYPEGVVAGMAAASGLGAALGQVDRRAAPRTLIDVEHSVNGPALARAAVTDFAQRVGIDEVCDDVVLLVSEMVTNAVRHASPPVRLELQSQAGDVVIAVRDGSPEEPEPRDADEDAEGGRGMLLVDLLTSEHGVRSQPPGKTVWARLLRRSGS
ncbi:MAG: hypothetical protein EPN99_16920 [Frankiales bacterium]|nr:MAG: hypothetical protein EPN99_16920 [Frankiales bacterium]